MGAWNDNRSQVMGCVCFSIGLCILVVGCTIFASKKPEEVKLWYNVPLCSAVNTTTATVAVANAATWFVSYAASSSAASTSIQSACPAGLNKDNLDPALHEITFKVREDFFMPETSYTTFLMMTDGVDIESTSTSVKVSLDQLYSVDTATASSGSGSSSGTRRMTGRKLLKGSFGGSSFGSSYSGPSYRSYSGSYSYYGASGFRRSRYGRYGRSAVSSDTVVMVYSPAPIYGAKSTSVTTGTTSYVATSNSACTNTETGCEYVLKAALTKAELEKATFTTPKEISSTKTYTLKTSASVLFNLGTAKTYPNLFVVFATATASPKAVVGYIMIPLGCVIMVFGTALGCMLKWEWCPDCGKTRSYGSLSTTESYSSNSNPMHGSASSSGSGNGRDPQVTMAMGLSGGKRFIRRDDSFRNIHQGDAIHIDLTSNDITTLSNSNMGACRTLIVKNNDITSLLGIATAAPNVENLDVADNDVLNFSGLGGVSQLRWLCVSNNRVNTIGGADSVPSLQYLDVTNNDIKNLAGIGAFPNLLNLDAGENDIVTAHGLAAACPNLQKVNLSQNNIIDPEGLIELAALPSLQYLNIKGNDMKAAQVQAVRDAFASRPGVLQS